jgi:hypothetical protein
LGVGSPDGRVVVEDGPVGHPLIEEAAKKAAIAWLNGRAVWCAWFDGALYVVGGAGTAGDGTDRGSVEQDLGDLTGEVIVTLRGDHGGRVISWPAAVTRVEPGSEEWGTVAPQLAGKRLNAVGTTDEVVARWASGCALYALRPADATATAGTDLPTGSLAEPPRPTTATRPARRPFRLHRVRKHP